MKNNMNIIDEAITLPQILSLLWTSILLKDNEYYFQNRTEDLATLKWTCLKTGYRNCIRQTANNKHIKWNQGQDKQVNPYTLTAVRPNGLQTHYIMAQACHGLENRFPLQLTGPYYDDRPDMVVVIQRCQLDWFQYQGRGMGRKLTVWSNQSVSF